MTRWALSFTVNWKFLCTPFHMNWVLRNKNDPTQLIINTTCSILCYCYTPFNYVVPLFFQIVATILDVKIHALFLQLNMPQSAIMSPYYKNLVKKFQDGVFYQNMSTSIYIHIYTENMLDINKHFFKWINTELWTLIFTFEL